jgi:dCMP deaminase
MNFTQYDISYMKMALIWAKNSHCKRKQVGAFIVKDQMIISDGFNGTPTGMDNCCEDSSGETKWHVIHAEANALMKLARSTNSANGATLYTTLSPCKECSKLILSSGISRIVFDKLHSDQSGIQLLKHANIIVDQLDISTIKENTTVNE